MTSHDGKNGLVVSEVDDAIFIEISNRNIILCCHNSQNALCVGEVNFAVVVNIAYFSEAAKLSMVATLDLPLEQGPAKSDGSVLVPCIPSADDVADLLLVLDAEVEEAFDVATLVVGNGGSSLAAICLTCRIAVPYSQFRAADSDEVAEQAISADAGIGIDIGYSGIDCDASNGTRCTVVIVASSHQFAIDILKSATIIQYTIKGRFMSR